MLHLECDPSWLGDEGEVAAGRQADEAGVRDAVGQGPQARRRDQQVAVARQDQGRHAVTAANATAEAAEKVPEGPGPTRLGRSSGSGGVRRLQWARGGHRYAAA